VKNNADAFFQSGRFCRQAGKHPMIASDVVPAGSMVEKVCKKKQ
jgi:hypothetical protein